MQLTKLRDTPSCFWRALVPLTILAAAAVVLSTLPGCAATKPAAVLPCPLPQADAFETPAGIFYVLDEANMQKLIARMEGLKDGTCLALPAPAPIPSARPT